MDISVRADRAFSICESIMVVVGLGLAFLPEESLAGFLAVVKSMVFVACLEAASAYEKAVGCAGVGSLVAVVHSGGQD